MRSKPQKILLVAFLGAGLTTAISMAVQMPFQTSQELNIQALPTLPGSSQQVTQTNPTDSTQLESNSYSAPQPGQVRSLISPAFSPPPIKDLRSKTPQTASENGSPGDALSDFEKQFNEAYSQFDEPKQLTSGSIQTTPTTVQTRSLPPIDGSQIAESPIAESSIAESPIAVSVQMDGPTKPLIPRSNEYDAAGAADMASEQKRLPVVTSQRPPVRFASLPSLSTSPNLNPRAQEPEVSDLPVGEVLPEGEVLPSSSPEQFDLMDEAVAELDEFDSQTESSVAPDALPNHALTEDVLPEQSEPNTVSNAATLVNTPVADLETETVAESPPAGNQVSSIFNEDTEPESTSIEGQFDALGQDTPETESFANESFASETTESNGSDFVLSPNNNTDLGSIEFGASEFGAADSSTAGQPSFNTNRPGNAQLTWWKSRVTKPLEGATGQQTVDTNSLVYQALKNSPRIQGLSQDPLIRELQVVEADAEFDAVHYVRSQFEDRVDPVGNSLTTGNGEAFLKDNIWSADLGLKKKARTGASYELNQRLGFQNSNSNFFSPQDQGTATLALNVTQPLLRGRGRYYNQSQILIAQSAGGVAWETFQSELQDELVNVVSTYWQLYLNRSLYLQKQENVRRGVLILDRLEGRSGLDSLPSQISRARSSVQTRKTELANSRRDVKNTETELRRLIADRNWLASRDIELLPLELPSTTSFDIPLEKVVYTALEHRPEIKQVIRRARIATIQRDVSANELLPELSLLLGTYVSALRGDSDLFNSIQDQFGQVKPGYNVGIQFELPYRNRAARSRHAQRNLQVKKIRLETDEVIQRVIAEAQISLRRVNSASETLIAAEEAIRAARADLDQFERRWESFALVEGDLADGQTPTTILDQLLDSQERLSAAELVYAQAEVELKVSEVALQRSMGTLLVTEGVHVNRWINGDHPEINLDKAQAMPAEMMVNPGGPQNLNVQTQPMQTQPMQTTQPLPPINQPAGYWAHPNVRQEATSFPSDLN